MNHESESEEPSSEVVFNLRIAPRARQNNTLNNSKISKEVNTNQVIEVLRELKELSS